ncbi:MAG: nucleotidyltransferase family protein, partial [Pseudomonadota bacterium]
SDETAALLETGGGLKHALPLLGHSPVLTMNTDAIWQGPNPLTAVINAWRDEMEALLLLVPRTQVFGHKGQGDFDIDADGRLHRAPGAVYSGVQIIRTEGLRHITEKAFSLNLLWNQIAARGGLYGTLYSGQWCDVGHPGSIPVAESLLNV